MLGWLIPNSVSNSEKIGKANLDEKLFSSNLNWPSIFDISQNLSELNLYKVTLHPFEL